MLKLIVTEIPQKAAAHIHPEAEVFLERGTFYVGIPKSPGQHVIGWGDTVHQAVKHAEQNYRD